MKSIGWKGLVMAAAVTAVVAGCSDNSQPASKDESSGKTVEVDAAKAKETYQSNCMSCHGEKLEGAQGPALEKVGAKMDAKKIETVIQRGQGTMPAQVSLNPEERENLAGWLAEQK